MTLITYPEKDGPPLPKTPTRTSPDNVLYEMDNLEVLRGMNSETVDLIVTDPPFRGQDHQARRKPGLSSTWHP